jgi:arginase
VLVIPQWQGYAVDDRPARGARAIAAALDRPSHEIAVPAWDPAGTGPEIDDVLWLPQIVDTAAAALRWLDAAAPARLLTIAGDCGSDFAPITWQAARSGGALGLLYVDAHADLNTPASSPSHRFHGMVARAVLGEAAPAVAALCRRPLAPHQLVMAGTRDLDAPERSFLDASGIRPWAPAAIDDGRVLAAVLAHRATRWHVHLDLDVLDPRDFPDVTIPTPGGPSLASVTALLAGMVGARDVASLSITEHVGGADSARRVAGLVAALERAGWR